ncbi:hypothetical protein DB347_24640 [Opitutaceae bacterium EW11]|nr:hypothetical protein DB347_24640 [Opitutaceae bacterium EW11]
MLYVDHLNRTYALDFGGERRLFHDYNTFFEAVARSRMVDGGDKPSERTPEQMSHVLRDAGWRVVSWSPASQGTAEVSFVRRAAVPRTKNAPAPHPWRIIPDDTVEARPSI